MKEDNHIIKTCSSSSNQAINWIIKEGNRLIKTARGIIKVISRTTKADEQNSILLRNKCNKICAHAERRTERNKKKHAELF